MTEMMEFSNVIIFVLFCVPILWGNSAVAEYTVGLSLPQNQINFGNDVQLLCSVSGKQIPKGLTWQFYKGSEKVSFDDKVKPSFSKKYHVSIGVSTSTLTIVNFSEEDLKHTVKCSYGAEEKGYTFVINKSLYTYLPQSNDIHITYEQQTVDDGYTSIKIELYFQKVYPVPYCWISITDSSIEFSVQKTFHPNKTNQLFETIFEHQLLSKDCEEKVELLCDIGSSKKHTIDNKTRVNCSDTSLVDHSQSEYGVTVVISCFGALLLLILIRFSIFYRKEVTEKYLKEKKCCADLANMVIYMTIGNSFLYGYNLSVVNLPAQISGLENGQCACLVSVFAFFGFLGSTTISIKISSNVDFRKISMIRQKTIVAANIVGCVASVFLLPSTEEHRFTLLVIHRCIMGFSNGLSMNATLQHLKERAPDTMKDTVSSWYQLSITLGILIGNVLSSESVLGSPEHWRWLFVLTIIPSLISIAGLRFHGRPKEIIPTKDDVPSEFHAIMSGNNPQEHDDDSTAANSLQQELDSDSSEETDTKSAKNSNSKSPALEDLSVQKSEISSHIDSTVENPEVKKKYVAYLLHICQQICGINIIMCYSSYIFTTLGVGTTQKEIAVVGTSLNNLIITAIAVFMVNKFDRKTMLILPLVMMIIGFCGLPFVLNNAEPETRGEYAAAGTILINFVVIGFALSLGPLPYIMIDDEMLPSSSSIAMTFNWFGNFAVLILFPFLKSYAFIIFAVLVFISMVLLCKYVPEKGTMTKVRTKKSMMVTTKIHNCCDKCSQLSMHSL